MSIAQRKRIAELEQKLAETEESKDKYMRQAAEYETALNEIGTLKESTPKDCVKGSWCRSCEFVKSFFVREYVAYSRWNYNTYYACGKGASCNNFVQKKWEENAK